MNRVYTAKLVLFSLQLFWLLLVFDLIEGNCFEKLGCVVIIIVIDNDDNDNDDDDSNNDDDNDDGAKYLW